MLLISRRNNFNDDEICMTAKGIIEIVKESELWALLTEKEEREVIKSDLESAQHSIADGDIGATVTECEFQVGKYEKTKNYNF